MKILAVDTSASVATVAITDDTKLLGEFSINNKKTHSQKLLPMIKELMSGLELKPSEIDVYAASSGPGSFTGLRIGVTTIKAMAFAAQKPVVSVPTLDALAYNIPKTQSLICPIMDARNNQVYTALYTWDGSAQVKLTEYLGLPVAELIQQISGKNQNVIFLGDGVDIHKELLQLELKGKCEFAPEKLKLQSAASVAQLAYIKALEGLQESCFDMVPFYLRKSQAERELEKKSIGNETGA
ncbi:MAG: tsaB [Clostridiales bacterium]|jgi:tRNA threonylcarbamoyladenosine biosynthesis protein TsaB|nr:tsaB [Clostridiales bacterium]